MEKFILTDDLKVLCVTAASFPDGIVEAFQALEKIHPSVCERPFYGISIQDKKGNMTYKAAVAEKYEGEAGQYGCETLVISRGDYLCETIFDFMQRMDSIPNAFQSLQCDPGFDSSFPLVEWYKSDKEVMCMVKLKPIKK